MKWISGIAAGATVFVVMLAFRACGPGGDGIIAHLTLPDQSEYLVTQTWNNDIGEPYTVAFYFRTKGGPWGWCYIDHEDTRWFRAELRHNSTKNSVEVFKGRELRAELFRTRQTFALYGSFNRELAAPQEWYKPPFQTTK